MLWRAATSRLVLVAAAAAAVATSDREIELGVDGPELSVEADTATTALIVVEFTEDFDEEVTPVAGWAIELEVDSSAGRLLGDPTVRVRVFDAATGELVADEASDSYFELGFDRACDDVASCSGTYDVEVTLDTGARARVTWHATLLVDGYPWPPAGAGLWLEAP